MAQTDSQRRAADAVAAWMAKRQWNNTQLVAATGADAGTIGDFLNGKRWPKTGTQGKIENALGWEPGTLRAIATGAEPPTVGGSTHDGDEENTLLFRRPEDLTDDEWRRVRRESRGFIEWQIEKASRER